VAYLVSNDAEALQFYRKRYNVDVLDSGSVFPDSFNAAPVIRERDLIVLAFPLLQLVVFCSPMVSNFSSLYRVEQLLWGLKPKLRFKAAFFRERPHLLHVLGNWSFSWRNYRVLMPLGEKLEDRAGEKLIEAVKSLQLELKVQREAPVVYVHHWTLFVVLLVLHLLCFLYIWKNK
jgi:hypothetical protein